MAFKVDGPLKDMKDMEDPIASAKSSESTASFTKYRKPSTLDTIEILGFTISVLEIYLLSSVFRSRQRLQYVS